jgi:hypothetical protein
MTFQTPGGLWWQKCSTRDEPRTYSQTIENQRAGYVGYKVAIRQLSPAFVSSGLEKNLRVSGMEGDLAEMGAVHSPIEIKK